MCDFDPGAVVTATWVHEVASYCPTMNTLKGNTKTNYTYRNWRKKWEEEFGPWLHSIPRAPKLRRVTITRVFGKGKRPFDRVNFAGGCKPLLDTLVNCGALYDDSPTWCMDYYLQERALDGVDRMRVMIEELSEANKQTS